MTELLTRSRGEMPERPRYREGAKQDERRWIETLDDLELAQLAAELGRIDREVRNFRAGRLPLEAKQPLRLSR